MTEMEIINGRINGVEKLIGNTNTTVNTMNENLKKVVILLQGNDFDKTDNGMIGEVTELRKKVYALEKFKDRATWVLVTAGCITGLNLFQLIDMVIKAFKH